jgi:hypothetical protein
VIFMPIGLSRAQIATLLGRGAEMPVIRPNIPVHNAGWEALQQTTHLIHLPAALDAEELFSAGLAVGWCLGRDIPVLMIGGAKEEFLAPNLHWWPDWNAFLRDLDRILANDPWWEGRASQPTS